MKKQDLIDRFRTASRSSSLATYLADYFEKLDIPADEKYDFWNIDPYLAKLLLEPIEAYYAIHGGESMPSITMLGPVNAIRQTQAQLEVRYLLEEVTGSAEFAASCMTLFTAEQSLMKQEFQRFVNQVHRKGLFDVISACKNPGMSGEFGKTTLRSYVLAGRLMYTFVRSSGDDYEESITFVCSDDDPNAMDAGLQTCYASLDGALAMFRNVITHWPATVEEQTKVYLSDPSIRLG